MYSTVHGIYHGSLAGAGIIDVDEIIETGMNIVWIRIYRSVVNKIFPLSAHLFAAYTHVPLHAADITPAETVLIFILIIVCASDGVDEYGYGTRLTAHGLWIV